MTPLALLVRAQELPPPPEPTGSPEIDTIRVIGVVILSLGVIVLLALAIRPLIVKPNRLKRTRADDDPSPEPEQAAPSGSGSIIPFPKTLVAEGAAGGPSWTESNATIAERFSRVVGQPGGRRRKLGDRNPARASHDLATAALHRVAPETGPTVHGGASVSPAAPPVAIHGSELETPTRFRTVAPASEWTPRLLTQAPERPIAAQMNIEEQPAVVADTVREDEVADLDAIEQLSESQAPNAAEESIEEEPENAALPTADEVVNRVGTVAPAGNELDTVTLASLHQVVRDLIYCANSGQLLQGFALYSDPYLFRFLDESGMSDEEFRDTYGSVKARPRDAWDHLDRLFDIVRLPGGAIEATASYVSAKGIPTDGLERYRFVEVDGIWMIDDITPLQPSAI